MSIVAETPGPGRELTSCTGCRGEKGAPLAAVIYVGRNDITIPVTTLVLCQECGRDAANAIGFMCIREGGWSKLEPRRKKAPSKPTKKSAKKPPSRSAR
jgi:hypothetical protein